MKRERERERERERRGGREREKDKASLHAFHVLIIPYSQYVRAHQHPLRHMNATAGMGASGAAVIVARAMGAAVRARALSRIDQSPRGMSHAQTHTLTDSHSTNNIN